MRDANECCFNECAFRPGEAWRSCWAVRLLVLKAKKTRFSLFLSKSCLSHIQYVYRAITRRHFSHCSFSAMHPVDTKCKSVMLFWAIFFQCSRCLVWFCAAVLIWLKRFVQWPNPNKTNSPIPETSSLSWQRGNLFCNFRFEMRTGEINVIKKIVAVAGWHNRVRELNPFSPVQLFLPVS